MEKILIDTDVVIDFLRGYNLRIKNLFEKIENRQINAYISIVSIIELYSGEDAQNKRKKEALEQILSLLKIINIDTDLGKKAGELKRRCYLGIADSIIASSSIKYQAKLLTFNTRHFKNIPGLSFYSL